MFKLSKRSMDNLKGVHTDLVKVVNRAILISIVDFVVIEGLRSLKKQRDLYDNGFSKTMDSRHLTGHAVDLAPILNGEISWAWPPFHDIAFAMKASARELKIPIVWGGDWISFHDGPHFELDKTRYPK